MHTSLLGGSEHTSRLNDVIGTRITPGNLGGVHLAIDSDGLSRDGDFLLASLENLARELAVDGIVLSRQRIATKLAR